MLQVWLPGQNGGGLLVSSCLFKDALLGLGQAQPLQHAGALWGDVHWAGLLHAQGGYIPQVRKSPCSFLSTWQVLSAVPKELQPDVKGCGHRPCKEK